MAQGAHRGYVGNLIVGQYNSCIEYLPGFEQISSFFTSRYVDFLNENRMAEAIGCAPR